MVFRSLSKYREIGIQIAALPDLIAFSQSVARTFLNTLYYSCSNKYILRQLHFIISLPIID